MSPRVLVVDDHPDFRASVRDLLQSGGWDVVGEAMDSHVAISATARLRPDVVLLDICLADDDPGGDGIDVAYTLATLPHPPVVVLVSARGAEVFGHRLAVAPVRGFVPKSELSLSGLTDLLDGGVGWDSG